MGGIQCIKCFVVAIIHRSLFCVAVAGFREFLAGLTDVEEAGIICGTGVEHAGDIEGKPERVNRV